MGCCFGGGCVRVEDVEGLDWEVEILSWAEWGLIKGLCG